MSSPAVQVEGLTHRYGERVALDQVDFEVAPGDFFALLGPNGGGKSSLFRILSTLMAPSQGRALVFGSDTVTEADAVRRHIGIVFQNPSLDVKLTVRENLRYQGHLYGLSGGDLEERIDRSLELASLTPRRDEVVERLSGGLQRRVELAKVTLHQPRLVLFDEPTSGLDPGARREFWDWVGRMQEESGTTILVTTHLLEEADRAAHVLLLDHGRVVAHDTPEALRKSLGGDILVLSHENPEELQAEVEEIWGAPGSVRDGTLRVELPPDQIRMDEVYQRFGPRVRSITWSHPTLEDVFIQRTGHGIAEEEA